MMIGKELADKVTEYRILNDQLMSKAMNLLESADNLMVEHEYEKLSNPLLKAAKSNGDDLLNNTLQFSKSLGIDTGLNLNQEIIGDIIRDGDTLENDIETMLKNMEAEERPKFEFPRNYTEDMFNFEATDDCVGLSENDDAKSIDDISNTNESESIIDRLLKTKLSIQQNGVKKKGKVVTKPIESDKVNNNCLKFLRARIESQQEELQTCNEKLKKKITECEELSKSNQSLQESKIRLMTQINNLKSASSKKDNTITSLNSKIQAVEGECRSVKNEHEVLSRAAKEAAHEMSSTEVRLSRALKEITSLKESLNNAKQREKESKESSRKYVDELMSGIKTAEKREKTIMAAIKKQALLIDNLKRQIIYLNSKVSAEDAEKQLDGILKWDK